MRKHARTAAIYGFAIGLVALADPRVGYFIAGALVTGAGLAIRLWAYGHLEKNHVLAMGGPYAHSRNPAYFGSFVAMIGLFVAAGNPRSARGLAVWAIGVGGVVLFIRVYMPAKYAREYPRLQAAFPAQFKRHAMTTPNFFPRASPAYHPGPARFSWRQLKRSRELKRPVFCALALALMWVI